MPLHPVIWISLAAFADTAAVVGMALSHRHLKRHARPGESWLGHLWQEPLLGLAVTMGAFLFALFCLGGALAIPTALAVAIATALCTSFGAYNRARVDAPPEARRAIAAFAACNALLLVSTLATASLLYLLLVRQAP